MGAGRAARGGGANGGSYSARRLAMQEQRRRDAEKAGISRGGSARRQQSWRSDVLHGDDAGNRLERPRDLGGHLEAARQLDLDLAAILLHHQHQRNLALAPGGQALGERGKGFGIAQEDALPVTLRQSAK